MIPETAGSSIKFTSSGFLNLIAPLIVVLLLIGGLLVPGGERTLVYPVAILCVPLIAAAVVRRLPRVHWIVIFIILIFGSLGLYSLMLPAPSSEYGVQKLQYFLTLTLLSASAACLIVGEDGIRRLAKTWVICASYLAVLTLVTAEFGLRAAPFDNNPIWVGRVFSAAIVMVVWLWVSRRVQWAWAVPVMGLLLTGLLVTGSRGPLLAAAAGVTVLLMLTGKNWKRMVVAGGITVALLVTMQLPLVQQSRIVSFASGDLLTDYYRSVTLPDSIRMISEYPLGVGVGNWNRYSSLPGFFRYPHNLFIEVASEFGIVLGALLVVFVAILLVNSMRKGGSSPAALLLSAWLMVETVHVSVSGDLNARTFFFVLALTFILVVTHNRREEGSQGLESTSRNLKPEPSLPPRRTST